MLKIAYFCLTVRKWHHLKLIDETGEERDLRVAALTYPTLELL